VVVHSISANAAATLLQGGLMSDEPTDTHDLGKVQPIAERLARETNRPIAQVAEIYANESAELERTARIKTFIGVLATRRTKIILDSL
jgi:hypothetical protein